DVADESIEAADIDASRVGVASEVGEAFDHEVGHADDLHAHFRLVGGADQPPAGDYCAVFKWSGQVDRVFDGPSAWRIEDNARLVGEPESRCMQESVAIRRASSFRPHGVVWRGAFGLSRNGCSSFVSAQSVDPTVIPASGRPV